MSNGPPARPDDAVDARWLFPQERAPSPPQSKRFDLASTLADFDAKLDARLADFEAKLDAFFDAFDSTPKSPTKTMLVLTTLRPKSILLSPTWAPNSRRLIFSLGRGSRRAFTSRHKLALSCGLRRSAPARTLPWRRISGHSQTNSTNASCRRTRPLRCSMRTTTMTRTRPSTSSGWLTTPTSNSKTPPSSSFPLRHFPIRVRSCLSWGGDNRYRLPTCCRFLSRLPSCHKRRHAD
jgi:hypothetical protein